MTSPWWFVSKADNPSSLIIRTHCSGYFELQYKSAKRFLKTRPRISVSVVWNWRCSRCAQRGREADTTCEVLSPTILAKALWQPFVTKLTSRLAFNYQMEHFSDLPFLPEVIISPPFLLVFSLAPFFFFLLPFSQAYANRDPSEKADSDW